MSGIERNKVKNFGEPSHCPSETAEGCMVVRCFLTPPGKIGLTLKGWGGVESTRGDFEGLPFCLGFYLNICRTHG